MDKDLETGKITYYRQLGGLRQRRDEEKESRDSFPAIAAHITAHARMHLYYLMRCAGTNNVYYCDTDSLLVDHIGRRNIEFLVNSYGLGGLKIVGEYDDIEIWGAKDYRFGSKEKHKGVRKTAIWQDSHNVTQASWSGLRGLVSSGIVDRPITKTIQKHLNRLYDKGTVLQDGRVLPKSLPFD
jgi:hypothetical protein